MILSGDTGRIMFGQRFLQLLKECQASCLIEIEAHMEYLIHVGPISFVMLMAADQCSYHRDFIVKRYIINSVWAEEI